MTRYVFVEHLEDLIHEADYPGDPAGDRVRLRISMTDEGIDILGDAIDARLLEDILESLESDCIQQTLCG